LTRHHLVRRPQCPACGDGSHTSERPLQPVDLQPSPKVFRADGGHRKSNPAETIAKYQHHISPITGAVTALEALPMGDSPLINVVFAGHNLAIRRGTLANLKSGLRQSSSGKGITPEQARASGLCEALERFSGNYTGTEPRRRGTLDGLGDDAIDPRSVVHWSERQYAHRRPGHDRVDGFNIVLGCCLDNGKRGNIGVREVCDNSTKLIDFGEIKGSVGLQQVSVGQVNQPLDLYTDAGSI
jgi:ribosomal protein S12 methylthiotransferase accessory factor